MTSPTNSWKRKLLFFLPLAIGVAVLVFAIKSKTPPPLAENGTTARQVRVVEAATLDVVPTTTTFGTVAPERTWNAVAEAAGRIIAVDDKVKAGSIVTKDTVLARIDPADYELALAELRAQQSEIAIKEANTRTLLDIEARNLGLAEQNLERKTALLGREATSQSAVDQEEQAVLAKRTAVQTLRNTLALVPAEKAALDAKIAQAERTLANTVIRAPYDIRIANVSVETHQYVGVGAKLFSGDAIDRVEVTAQVAMERLLPLLRDGAGDVTLDVPGAMNGSTDLATFTGFTARVRYDLGGRIVEWPGRVVRFLDTIDPKTRTLGVVVAVDDPYRNVQPGVRPPLVKGLFVDVVLQGAAQGGRVVIPASAVREDVVAIVENGLLKTVPVTLAYRQGDAAVVASGLTGGEKVIVSDVLPSVDGLAVEPVADSDLAERMAQSARGEGAAL